MKKIFVAGSIALFMLAGCNTTGTDDETSQEERKSKIEQTRYDENANHDNRNRGENNKRMTNERDMNERNTNDRYDVSEEAADAITSKVSEVNSAYVVTIGNKAYVAAMFDDEQDTNTNQKDRNMDRNNNQTNEDPDSNKNNRDLNRTDDGMGAGGQLTDDIKKKISDIVRKQDDTIEDVYVTTNPEFSNLTREYMDEVDAGNPLGGFFDQFGNMIERLFPQNKK